MVEYSYRDNNIVIGIIIMTKENKLEIELKDTRKFKVIRNETEIDNSAYAVLSVYATASDITWSYLKDKFYEDNKLN